MVSLAHSWHLSLCFSVFFSLSLSLSVSHTAIYPPYLDVFQPAKQVKGRALAWLVKSVVFLHLLKIPGTSISSSDRLR